MRDTFGPVTVAGFLADLLGPDLPVAIRAYDGSVAGPADAATTIVIKSPSAMHRIVTAPNELGLGRAYVSGDLAVDGNLFDALALAERVEYLKVRPSQILDGIKLLGLRGLKPVPRPPEEARLHGRRHSRERDAAAIAHHYDVSNDFYGLVLGPSFTYSCAVWTETTERLEDAQAAKHELICRKLGLDAGKRLLDIGSGWGSMLIHAARHHGVKCVGVTVSERQVAVARRRVAELGLEDRVEIRLQDYRDVDDGPYDAISSVGMFEHVGMARLGEYFERCHSLLGPQGRLLNHAISRPAHRPARSELSLPKRFLRHDFIDRFVFPDGELHEIGQVISAMQKAGFEARHMESLREHYARTLRAWVANLERQWDEAVAIVGIGRVRVWHLYMAAAAVGFEANQIEVHQTLGTKTVGGVSGLPLRPAFT